MFVHLHQSTDPIELLGILAITFMGSILFAWLYVEWNYNIWVPMCLHALMDVAWYLFATGPTALGGLGANLFRGLTIVLALVLTVAYKRRTGQPFVIRRSTLWQQAKPG